MMNQRHGNTAREMAQDGEWNKIARKSYAHISGFRVAYDNNRYAWDVFNVEGVRTGSWGALWVARYNAEREAAAVDLAAVMVKGRAS